MTAGFTDVRILSTRGLECSVISLSMLKSLALNFISQLGYLCYKPVKKSLAAIRCRVLYKGGNDL